MNISETRLSDVEVEQVLKRAASLAGEGLTVYELQQAAAEAGIDPNAVAIALSETLAARVDKDPLATGGSTSRWSQLRRPIKIGIASFAAGAFVYLAGIPTSYGNESLNLLCTAAMCISAWRIAMKHQDDGDQGDLQMELLALWGSYGAGFSIMRGEMWDDMTLWLAAFWLGSAIVGGIAINAGRWKHVKAAGQLERIGSDHEA